MSWHGQSVAGSGGLVLGVVQKLDDRHHIIPEYKIKKTQHESEFRRFSQAILQARLSLQNEMIMLKEHPHAHELLPILESHHLMLSDPELEVGTKRFIEQDCINTEWALKRCLARFEQAFEHMDDVYLKSRKADISQVGQRIFQCLGTSPQATNQAQSIMLAVDFSPTDVVSMWRDGVAGFVASQGGKDSHTMIVARGVGLTGLVGTHDLFDQAEDGDILLLNAEDNTWRLNPTADECLAYELKQQQLDEKRNELKAYASQPSQSKDGYHLPLLANIEFVEEVDIALQYGVDGIGLFRTEFLFMQSDTLPCEEEQAAYYQQIVQGMGDKPITFRLLDVGADKLAHVQAMFGDYDGENPALGLRGVRMLLRNPSILKTQLRAILSCAKTSDISILVPMVVSVNEMIAVRKQLQEAKLELGIQQDIALGCMIEVPAAALIAEDLAKVSDFFSIGSNDLVQYGLAVDRSDEHVGYLYDVNHTAIKRLIQMAVDAAIKRDIPITVCGELAANTSWTQTFLNMQISGLSMTARHVLAVRKQLRAL